MTLDREITFRLIRMTLFLALGALAIFIEAAPVDLSATALPSPDLLLCVVVFWALRRPGSTPTLLIFALGLTRDLLTDAPIGAGTLSLVLTAEVIKEYRGWIASRPFLVEWLAMAGAALAGVLLQWLLITVTFGQPPYLGQLATLALFTVAAYPLVVFLLRWGLRIGWRKRDRARPVRP
ncbi:MAG: rod shape-determining protein MreD [Pseudomonadota bacterium]